MIDVPEEQNSEQFDLSRYLNVARRRYMQFVIPFFLGWLVVWGASWVLQPRYKSSTLILVEEPTMPKDYVQPNVSNDLQDKLQSITQQILSRTRLAMIIKNQHLYPEGGASLSDDERVERMRKDIDIELVRDARNNEITAFRIFYSARNPLVAQQVTSELKNLFIDETLRVRQQQSEGTTKFIESQLEDARGQLAQQEAKKQAFEATHQGALPTQEASNLQILSGLQSQLQNEQDSLNTARQQRVYLQAQIAEYKNAKSTPRTIDGIPTGVAAMDVELTKLRAQLTDLLSRYTESYPDVKKLKEQIAQTQRMRDEMAANPKGAGLGDASHDGDAAVPGSPIAQLQGSLQANQLEIANREKSVSELKDRINEYNGRLNSEPTTEQELAALTRGYDQTRANYDDLLKKKNESEMATSMEQMQQGERFTMLDPPSLPVKPDFPNRLKFCAMGLGVGFGLGLVVAAGFEFMDDKMHNEKEIKALLPVAVISEIPDVVSTSDEEASKKSLHLRWATAAVVVVAIVAGAAISYLSS